MSPFNHLYLSRRKIVFVFCAWPATALKKSANGNIGLCKSGETVSPGHTRFYGFGNPGDPTLPGLQSLVQSLGLQQSVRLNGWTNHPAEEYETAGLSLLTSQGEAFSLSIMESLCHGCPPIAFDVPYGPSHLIDHGQTGLLVPFGDVEALATAIISVFDNDKLHESLSNQARDRSLRFRPAAVARQWQNLFSSLGLVSEGG